MSIGDRTAQNSCEKVTEDGCLEVMLARTCSSEVLPVSECNVSSQPQKLKPGAMSNADALDASSAHPAARQEHQKVS